MKLTLTTPLSVMVAAQEIASLTAEDATGAFGILPHHAPFLTALGLCVVGWRGLDGRQCYCAVRGGLLTVTPARDVEIATREAVLGDDLDHLQADVLAHFESDREAERTEHAEGTKLQLRAIRQMMRYLSPDGQQMRGLP